MNNVSQNSQIIGDSKSWDGFNKKYSKFLPAVIVTLSLLMALASSYFLVNVSPLIAIGILFALPLVIFTFVKPDFGMLLVIFVLPLEELNIKGGFSAIKMISVLVFGCAILNYLIFPRETRLVKSSQNILIFVFLLISLISVFVAFSPERTLDRIPKLLRVLSLYFFAINFIKSEKYFRSALWMFVIGGFVCTLYGFFDPAQTIGRFEGAIGQPNGYALTMTPRIPIALALIIIDKNLLKRIFLAFVILTISYGVILSASRGGLLSVSFALIVFAALQKNRKTWLGVIGVIFALGILIMPLDIKVRVGLSDAYTSTDLGNSTDRRLTYQIYGLELFQKYPVLGVGLDGFAEAYAQSEYRFLVRTQNLRVAHNTYLEIATGTGVVGFLPFMGILGFAMYLAWKYSRKKYWYINAELAILSSGLLAALSGYYLGMLFGSRQYEKTLWFLFALPIVVETIINAQVKAKSNQELLKEQISTTEFV